MVFFGVWHDRKRGGRGRKGREEDDIPKMESANWPSCHIGSDSCACHYYQLHHR
uniref:Uncharacterized protein n=1 Tax=Vitis vinifera TaxID=29760 RepID=F6I6A6_VITVI